MEEIRLEVMTEDLCQKLYREWKNDPELYKDPSEYVSYVYDEEKVSRYYASRQNDSRILFALMRDDEPIGEIQLKQIDREKRECTLSIHLQNDSVKNRGYGSLGERLAVGYAFEEMDMLAVNADALISNVRSQRVLEKTGFRLVREENGFRYYRLERIEWKREEDAS